MRRGQAHRIGLRGHVFRCVAGPLALLVLLDLLASATLAVHYAGQRYDADLLASGRALAKLVEQRDDHVQLPAAARFLLAHEGHRSLYFQVVDRQGRTVAGNAHLTGGAKAASADVALYDLSMPDGPARAGAPCDVTRRSRRGGCRRAAGATPHAGRTSGMAGNACAASDPAGGDRGDLARGGSRAAGVEIDGRLSRSRFAAARPAGR